VHRRRLQVQDQLEYREFRRFVQRGRGTEKLRYSVKYGADTVMDLSTGGDIPAIRKAILDASQVPIGTVPIYEALSRVRRVEDLSARVMLDVIEEQAEQGVDYMTIPRGRAGPAHSAHHPAHHRDCQPRRLHTGRVDGEEPPAEHALRVLRRHLQDLPEVRRDVLAGGRVRPGSVADASDEAQFAELKFWASSRRRHGSTTCR